MKKFKFNIKGTDYDVNVKKVEDNLAEIEVNGTNIRLKLTGRYSRQKPLHWCVQ
jgi:glutaconyl-CoA/methylmalonyl-CoA decarboxylase subunit gamma